MKQQMIVRNFAQQNSIRSLSSHSVLPPIVCQLPGIPKKLESEIEIKVKRAMSLSPCVIKMDITKEHV